MARVGDCLVSTRRLLIGALGEGERMVALREGAASESIVAFARHAGPEALPPSPRVGGGEPDKFPPLMSWRPLEPPRRVLPRRPSSFIKIVRGVPLPGSPKRRRDC